MKNHLRYLHFFWMSLIWIICIAHYQKSVFPFQNWELLTKMILK